MPSKEKGIPKRKDSLTLVVTDSPDDAERFETGDAADFAGKSDSSKQRQRQGTAKEREK